MRSPTGAMTKVRNSAKPISAWLGGSMVRVPMHAAPLEGTGR